MSIGTSTHLSNVIHGLQLYLIESTSSYQMTEGKQSSAWIVVGWVTALLYQVIYMLDGTSVSLSVISTSDVYMFIMAYHSLLLTKLCICSLKLSGAVVCSSTLATTTAVTMTFTFMGYQQYWVSMMWVYHYH